MEKAFDGVPRKVTEWAMGKNFRAVMSLCDDAKTRARVISAYSEIQRNLK